MNWFKSSETLPGINDKYLVYTHAGEFKILQWDGRFFYYHEFDGYRSERTNFSLAGAPYWCYLEPPK